MPNWLKIYLSGVFMGMADVVPGVSGGTMAFILGVYDRLINALSGVNKASVKMLLKGNIKGLWRHFDLTFLLLLGMGILTSIALFARVISYWLINYPTFVWSFFFGLILASSVLLIRQIESIRLAEANALLLGVCLGVGVSLLVPAQLQISYYMIFLAGMIAICAMILPGISGSFMLLMMGMYGFILTAIKGMQFDVIFVFAMGALLGIMSFSKLLKWLLMHYQSLTFALLTGVMLGALVKVWPWKVTQEWVLIGEKKYPSVESLVLPWHYEGYQIGTDLLLPIGCMLLGLLSIFLISYIFLPKSKKHNI